MKHGAPTGQVPQINPQLGATPAARPGDSSAAGKAAEQKHDYGTIFFKAGVGSFKILGGNDIPAEGQLGFDFTGTVLVSGIDPKAKLTVTGAVDKEIDNQQYSKQVFFGHGHMAIDGKFKAVQFFGRDVNASFNGWGVVRMTGEFDKNLDTGSYWYANDPKSKYPWGTSMVQAPVPVPYQHAGPAPTLKVHKGS